MLALAHGATGAVAQASVRPQADAPARIAELDPAQSARILALDPRNISERDVRDVLSAAPAPRIIALHGSVAFVTMEPFSEFLVAMGYPEAQVRNPKDGAMTGKSSGDSAELAGELAWYYEREGMMPMLIGHSQGGMLVVRTLHELAGEFAAAIPVRNPLTDETEARTTIVDPLTGAQRPVVGLQVPYATAIATGKLPRLLLGQWSMLTRLRKIPDSVEDFTGFAIAFDPIAGDFGGADPYRATGTARVRNVTLPASYSHIGAPSTDHLARNGVTRAWINAYVPAATPPAVPEEAGADARNILHAADIWFSVKKHWCLEAQRMIRAVRAEAPR